MEARIDRSARAVSGFPAGWVPLILMCCCQAVHVDGAVAAGYRTANFTVDAPTPRLAKEIGDAAEQYRSQLAHEWLGKSLPNWSRPCPIKAQVAPNLGAGGETSFIFDSGEVFGWRMRVQGSRERILDSVVPHEVTHTIFASHFRQPIPRWADEGACTTVEHRTEISKQEDMLINFLKTGKGIPFSSLLAMKEYPADVLPLYAHGHSLTKFLIDQRGKREFMAFLADGLADENWIRAIRERYGYRDLLTLQNTWQNWIVQGRPPLRLAADADTDTVLVAAHEVPTTPSARPAVAVIRGQDPGAGRTNSIRTLASKGIDGRIGRRPRGNLANRTPWSAVGGVPKSSTVSSTPASVYDARATGRILR